MPTGRNLTTLDPRAIPSRAATLLGEKAAQAVVTRYLQDEGSYPRPHRHGSLGVPDPAHRGEDVAHALSLMVFARSGTTPAPASPASRCFRSRCSIARASM